MIHRKRLLCPNLPRLGAPVTLTDSEAHHALKVLRLQNGDEVEAMDGEGGKVLAILKSRQGKAVLEFLEGQARTENLGVSPIVLEMSVLKGEAMEWVVEKAVELGVEELIPVLTAHTVVQMKSKGPEAFQERWQKIADQALKQCDRLNRIEVKIPTSLEDLLTQSAQGKNIHRIWLDENQHKESSNLETVLHEIMSKIQSIPGNKIHLLVGPEGGWSEAEREMISRTAQCFQVGLGPLVMRAETAALYASSVTVSKFRAART